MRMVLSALLGLALAGGAAAPAGAQAAPGHPQQVTVSGRSYRWPARPLVVVLVDGNDPEYVKRRGSPCACS